MPTDLPRPVSGFRLGDVTVTQADLDKGARIWCPCHGWVRPPSLAQICPAADYVVPG